MLDDRLNGSDLDSVQLEMSYLTRSWAQFVWKHVLKSSYPEDKVKREGGRRAYRQKSAHASLPWVRESQIDDRPKKEWAIDAAVGRLPCNPGPGRAH